MRSFLSAHCSMKAPVPNSAIALASCTHTHTPLLNRYSSDEERDATRKVLHVDCDGNRRKSNFAALKDLSATAKSTTTTAPSSSLRKSSTTKTSPVPPSKSRARSAFQGPKVSLFGKPPLAGKAFKPVAPKAAPKPQAHAQAQQQLGRDAPRAVDTPRTGAHEGTKFPAPAKSAFPAAKPAAATVKARKTADASQPKQKKQRCLTDVLGKKKPSPVTQLAKDQTQEQDQALPSQGDAPAMGDPAPEDIPDPTSAP